VRLTIFDMANDSLKQLSRTHQPGLRLTFLGPGRVGPALADFWVEPQPLAYWKLKKSFVRTPPYNLSVCRRHMGRFVESARGPISRPLSPRERCLCQTIVTLLFNPFPYSSQSVSEDARRCSSARCAREFHGGLLIVAIVQTARHRHSRSQGPEMLGRIVFFVVATGRSPP
jgi:hypothetical protein